MNGYMDFPGEPFLANKAKPQDAFTLGDYNPLNPNAGFAGFGSDKPVKAILRPKSGAVPGWPGFFGWLADQHPELYDYARVSLPNLVEDRQGIVGAGAQLGYLGWDRSSQNSQPKGMGWDRTSQNAQPKGMGDVTSVHRAPHWDDPGDPIVTPYRTPRGVNDAASVIMNGLGDVHDSTDVLTSLPTVGLQSVIQTGMLTSQSATEGITDSTPMPTSTGTNSIADTLSKLASAFIPVYAQKKIFDLQLARAKAGLPPLDTSNIIDPNAGLSVGINKGTQNTILMVAGIGVAALILHKVLKKR